MKIVYKRNSPVTHENLKYIYENFNTVSDACKYLCMDYDKFKYYAKKYKDENNKSYWRLILDKKNKIYTNINSEKIKNVITESKSLKEASKKLKIGYYSILYFVKKYKIDCTNLNKNTDSTYTYEIIENALKESKSNFEASKKLNLTYDKFRSYSRKYKNKDGVSLYELYKFNKKRLHLYKNKNIKPKLKIENEKIIETFKNANSNLDAAKKLNISRSAWNRIAKNFIDKDTNKTIYELLNTSKIKSDIFIKTYNESNSIEEICNKLNITRKQYFNKCCFLIHSNLIKNKFKLRISFKNSTIDLLAKKGLIEKKCQKCGYENVNYNAPLKLIFLDNNNKNTSLSNIKVLCYNCNHIEKSLSKEYNKEKDVNLEYFNKYFKNNI